MDDAAERVIDDAERLLIVEEDAALPEAVANFDAEADVDVSDRTALELDKLVEEPERLAELELDASLPVKNGAKLVDVADREADTDAALAVAVELELDALTAEDDVLATDNDAAIEGIFE
ncbi:hypothetical protein Q5752_004049 [Cryptotrichosporon argae]